MTFDKLVERSVRLKCSGCGLTMDRVLHVDADVILPAKAMFTCAVCCPTGGRAEEPTAFDGARLIGKANGMDGDVDNFDSRFDVADVPSWLPSPAEAGFGWNKQRGRVFIPLGYHTHKVRRPRKRVPAWMRTKEAFERVLMAHPQARKLAKVWRRVSYLYWHLQCGAPEVAETMRAAGFPITTGMVKKTVGMLQRRAARLDARLDRVRLHAGVSGKVTKRSDDANNPVIPAAEAMASEKRT
jgi:hypothetical protein